MGRPNWRPTKVQKYWRGRKTSLIYRISNVEHRLASMRKAIRERAKRKQERKRSFRDQNLFRMGGDDKPHVSSKTAEDLEFWAKYLSWNYCGNCQSLVPQKLMPNYVKRMKLVPLMCNACKTKKYRVPQVKEVPIELRGLQLGDIIALRPLQIYTGQYSRKQHGYRVRVEPFKIVWCSESVEDKINALSDQERQQRVKKAYDFLMQKQDCRYKEFVEMQSSYLRQPFLYEQYSHSSFRGVESAMWPHLYHQTSLCESAIEGGWARKSSKVSFMTKVTSPILDYGVNYELLHYHYDRWLFKTITGAINSSRNSRCSPAQALEAKDFSELFWRNQHGFLIDAVRQNGFPDLFITISPFEWSFPFAAWIDNSREKTGSQPTELPVMETLHIAHVLEQIVRGYICGKNTNRWRKHLMACKSSNGGNNVSHYFYRFEFQKRGTLHVHMLLWLQDMHQVDMNALSATVPRTSVDDAFAIYDLQKSSKTCLPIHLGSSMVVEDGETTKIVLHYDEADYRSKIRTYIPSLSASLKCSMDIQSADGKGMLLKYVSSYVTKNQDTVSQQELFSKHITAYQAANTFLRHMQPLEPEMAMQLSNIKMAWTDARTKTAWAPSSSQDMNATYRKYLERPPSQENNTFLEWLRSYDTTKSKPTPYKSGSTFVAVKYFSIFNPEYFHQVMAMYVKHRRPDELRHARDEDLPSPVRFYAAAVEKLPHIFSTSEDFVKFLASEAHKRHYLENAAAYLRSLQDVLNLWRIHVVDGQFGSNRYDSSTEKFPLSPQQKGIRDNLVELARASRRAHYASQGSAHQNIADTTSSSHATYQMLLGPPGMVKSQVIKSFIEKLLEEEISVAFSAPLGILSSSYHDLFESKLTCDTIHGLFKIPVNDDDVFSVNYGLHHFDVLVIDEASMVTEESFAYIARTISSLPHRPLLVLTGDEQQQPPLKSEHGRTTQAKSILHNPQLRAVCQVTKLHSQYRTKDKSYQDFLEYIRYTKPHKDALDNFQRPLVLFEKDKIEDDDIWQTITRLPHAKFLTISRAAAGRVNEVVLRNGFPNSRPLSDISLQHEGQMYPPKKEMKAVITRNLNKKSGLVNGRSCKIIGAENRTLLVSFANGIKNFIYPMTTTDDNGETIVKYPLAPAYGETVCKTQGATISKLVVWFDSAAVPSGMAYVALSRVRDSSSIRFLTKASAEQFNPAIQ